VLAYTGDTEWVDALIEAGHDVDILIAECYTYDRKVRFHLDYASLKENLPRIGLEGWEANVSYYRWSRISALGQKRRLDSRQVATGLPRSTDVVGAVRHFAVGPRGDIRNKKSQLMLAIVAVFLLWQALLRNLPAHASRRTLPLSRIGTARTSGRSLFIRSRVSGLHVSGRTSS
jgi:hypothetical protein